MRILFLTHYFPPEVNAPASRTFEHCRVWSANGHEVSVLTNVPNHPQGKLYPGYANKVVQVERVAGINVYRMLTFLAANRGVVRRSLNYFFYLVMAFLSSPFLPRTDIVISTSPQFFCGLAGYLVSRVKRAPWVLEIRDLWPESIVAVGAMRKSIPLRIVERLAVFAYQHADHIVCVSDSLAEHIKSHGVASDRVSVIKGGVDLELFSPSREAVTEAVAHGLAGKFVVSYVGTHGLAHGLDTILEAADLLRGDRDIVFLLVGDGADRQRLLNKREMMRLNNVVMLGQQAKDQMPRIWSTTSASLVLLRDKPLFQGVIPSKIFESMAMARPIILGVRGESQRLLEESGAGICIPPESAIQLARAVRRLRDEPDTVRQMGTLGRRFVEQNFDRDLLAKRFQVLLESMLAAHRESSAI